MKKDFGLVLDGGDSPALSITDRTLFDAIAQEFVAAIESGRLPPDNLTGAVTTPMDINGVTEDVPIVNVPEYHAGVENLDTFYDELIAGVGSLISTARNIDGRVTDGDDRLEFGTADSPVVVRFDSPIFLHDADSITGYGTLIVSKELRLGMGTKLIWNGDLIVYGDASQVESADIRVAGDFMVNGNLLVLGEGGTSSWFRVDKNDGARAVINGSFLVATIPTVQKPGNPGCGGSEAPGITTRSCAFSTRQSGKCGPATPIMDALYCRGSPMHQRPSMGERGRSSGATSTCQGLFVTEH